MKTRFTLRALTIGALTALAAGFLVASGPVTVEQTSVSGPTALVLVHNSGSQAENVVVSVTVAVAGQQVENVAPASVAAGESLVVPVSFGDMIEEIIQVGIITDDSGPY